MNKRNAYLLAVLAAGLLSACGGGGNDSPPAEPVTPSNTVPPSAWATIAAYFSYTGSLAASETSTPLLLGDAEAPTSESAVPSPVN